VFDRLVLVDTALASRRKAKAPFNAMPNGQFHRDETAEAVAEQVGVAGQAELRSCWAMRVGNSAQVRVRPAPKRRIRAD